MARRIVQAAPDLSQNLKPLSRKTWLKREPVTAIGQRIVSATIEEFAAKGVLGARVAEITRRAGTTDPTFYRYFPGIKQAALYIMSEHYWAPLNLRLSHYYQITDDPVRLFEATVDTLIQSTSDDPKNPMISESKVFQIVVAQSRNPVLLPESLLDDEYLGFLAELEKIIQAGQKQKQFSSEFRPALLSSLLVNSLHGLLVQNKIPYQFFQSSEDEVRQLARHLVGLK